MNGQKNQREMPMLGATKPPEMVPWPLIERCRDGLDAVRLCVQLSHMSNDALCRTLGVDPGHWTRMMQGRAQLVHEVTHLSPREDDGSHWCRITAATLEKARRAIANEQSARDPFGEAFNSGDGSYRP